MARNILFLILYVLLSGMVSAETLYYILIAQSALGMIVDLNKKKIEIDPLFIFYFSLILSGVANILLIEKIGKIDFKTYSYIIPKYRDDAALIWCISSSLIITGFEFIKTKSFPPVDYVIKDKKNIDYMFYILLLVNILSILGIGINYKSGSFFKVFGLLNTIGILFFARLWGKEDDRTYRTYAVTLFLLETYIALTTSFLRTELILPTIYLTVGYFIGKRDIRYIFSYRIIPVALVLLVFSSNFASFKRNRSNFIDVFKGEVSRADQMDDNNSSSLVDRSANLAQLTNVVKLVKQNGFYKGKASAPLAAALIPRFLWPDKPIIALGTWFALEIGAAYRFDDGRINNSINMTIPGELYLDFGWVGIVIGSLIVGMLIAAFWHSAKFYSSQYNLIGIIFGGYLMYAGFLNFGADLQVMLTTFSTYLIFLIIKKIMIAI